MGARSESRFVRHTRDYYDRQIAASRVAAPVAWHINEAAARNQLAARLGEGHIFTIATRTATVSAGPYATASNPDQFAIIDERNVAHGYPTAGECAAAFMFIIHPATIYCALRRIAMLAAARRAEGAESEGEAA